MRSTFGLQIRPNPNMHLPPQYGSERELVDALRNSTTRESAFRDAIHMWQRPLYGHLRRMMGNHEDAADVLQDTWVKWVKNIHEFRGDSALYTWLMSIANRTALDALRKRQRDRLRWGDVGLSKKETGPSSMGETLEPADEQAWNEWHGHDSWNEASALRRLMAAVESLPDRQRAVFVLRYFEAMPYKQMAQAMGVTESTVKALYHHAKAKLRDALNST